jgi:hypothetical protein
MKKYFDPASIIVIAITCGLFVTALFTKDFTHDLLLEAGVLLVSVKLIMMTYKNGKNFEAARAEWREIRDLLQSIKG